MEWQGELNTFWKRGIFQQCSHWGIPALLGTPFNLVAGADNNVMVMVFFLLSLHTGPS